MVAAALAATLLLVTRQGLPERRHWRGLVVTGSGVIVGFPLFTSLALRELPSADAAVIVGLLPAATAVMAVLRAGERPSRAFWGACVFGLFAVLLFAVSQGAGLVPGRGHLAWSILGSGGAGLAGAGPAAWACFAYVSVVSMFLGFFAWYRGLAEGGVARIGQVQLSQPVLTLLWSVLLLGERVGPLTVLCALLVLGSVAVGQRTRVKGKTGGGA
jgi:drug/metabolite transporter (DMT)-like permease